ncbi:MAG: response regulator, partial [Gemmatimonadetes bacterium]|nr:response regulator [Gemmatimonadota bacterium]
PGVRLEDLAREVHDPATGPGPEPPEIVPDLGGHLRRVRSGDDLFQQVGVGLAVQLLPSDPAGKGDEVVEGLAFDLRGLVLDLLERDGYHVVEARNGVEALDQIDRYGPDIIVLDLNLPGLDGYGVLSHLRSRPATADIPVVVLTARGDEENEVRVFEHGADDFLSKPFRARALSARLAAVLGRRRGRQKQA